MPSRNGKSDNKGPSWASAVKGASKSWHKAREVEDSGGGGGPPDIADGTYIAKFATASLAAWAARPAKKPIKRGGKIVEAGQPATPAVPYARLGFVIARGEAKGQQPTTTLKFVGSQSTVDHSSKQLQRLIGNNDYELPEDLAEMPKFFKDMIQDYKENNVLVRIGVKNGEYNGNPQQNVFINSLVESDEDSDDEEEDEFEDEEDLEDEESDDEEDSDEEDDSDESDDEDSTDDDDESESEDDEEDSDEEEDEDEEEEKPRKRPTKKPIKKATKKKVSRR